MADKEAMMRRNAPFEVAAKSKREIFGRDDASPASLAALVLPAIIAFKIRRPLMPIMS